MQYLTTTFYFILGAMFGSFLNVVVLRLPQQEKLTGRSHCPHCGKTLGALELVPLLSWLALGGKCKKCRHKISPRYFIIELTCALLFAFSFSRLQPTGLIGYLALAKYLLAILTLAAVFIIDLEHYIILDVIVFPMTATFSLLNLALDLSNHNPLLNFHSHLTGGLWAALIGALPFFLIWLFSSGKWMGFGDVKLALLLGTLLGWPLILIGLMLGILSGGFFSTFLLLFTSKTLKSQVPFGTFLSLGTLLALFYGEPLLRWYLSILGF